MDKIPAKVIITSEESVTIPRSEYNELIAAKTEHDMIIAVAGADGYGCSDIIKGMRALDKYRSALTAAEARISDMAAEHSKLVDDLSAEIVSLKSKLGEASDTVSKGEPEATPDA